MPDALQEFTQQTIDKLLKELPARKLVERLTPQERVEGLSVHDILANLGPAEKEELARALAEEGSKGTEEKKPGQ
jgi:hypothetical protein